MKIRAFIKVLYKKYNVIVNLNRHAVLALSDLLDQQVRPVVLLVQQELPDRQESLVQQVLQDRRAQQGQRDLQELE